MKIIWISLSVKSKMTKLSLWLEMNCEYMRNIHQGDTGKHKNCIEASQKKKKKISLSLKTSMMAQTGEVSFYSLLSGVESSSRSPLRGGLCYSRGGPGGGTKTLHLPPCCFWGTTTPGNFREMNHTVWVWKTFPLFQLGGILNVYLWGNKGRVILFSERL